MIRILVSIKKINKLFTMQLLESSSVFFSISYLYNMFEFELHLLYKYFLNNDIYTENNTV